MEEVSTKHPAFMIGESLDPSDAEESSNIGIEKANTTPPIEEVEADTLVSKNSESSNKEGSEDSPPSDSNDPLKNKSIAKTPSRIITTDTTHVKIEPEHIVEYEWPLKSSEHYFIQEQISQLLDVKSFKRKYPEMSRRTVEPRERDHLLNQLNLGQSLAPHYLNHLTALRSVEVYDLMLAEYPDIHAEYQKYIADRIKQELLEKQKELDLIKSDAKKMEELRKKAIKSAAEFNSELQMVKKSERKYFLDIQTSIIQSPASRWYKLPKEASKPSAYPVALIPGQYTSHFQRFSFDKLNRLPLNSVIDSADLFSLRRDPSPSPIHVSDQEIARRNAVANHEASNHHSPFNADSLKEETSSEKSSQNHTRERETPTPAKVLRRSSTCSGGMGGSAKKARKLSTAHSQSETSLEQMPQCVVCGSKELPVVDPAASFVKCSICLQHMHSSCIDMPSSMVPVVQSYNWSCIDCKMCDVCCKPDQEDAMMCCDLCDRGYHTFCVGLAQPPCGAWICSTCQAKSDD